MKKIWIDGYEANVPQRLGSGTVAFELLKNLERIDSKNDYTIILPSPPLSDLPKERDGWRYKVLKPKFLWTRVALPLALFLAKERPDIFFTPTHYIPRFSPASVKRIATIFDLSYLYFPQAFTKKDLWQLEHWTKYSVLHADQIITISNSSKKDIIKRYKTPKDKIIVAYPGYNSELMRPLNNQSQVQSVLDKYNLKKGYILFIGTLQPRKNLIRLMEAVTRIENVELVIVGKAFGEGRSGWKYEEILETPKKLGIEERVKFTGFVPDDSLPYLINGASVFVSVSLYEGFGIPVVDAMACGTPVVVSNLSSLPEIVGKAGLLVDPNSVDQIEQALRLAISDKRLRMRLSKQGIKRAKKFSWKKMAKEVLKVFENV